MGTETGAAPERARRTFVLGVLLLAACGGDGGEPVAGTGTDTTGTTSSSTGGIGPTSDTAGLDETGGTSSGGGQTEGSESSGESTGETAQGCTNMMAVRFAVSGGADSPDCETELMDPPYPECEGLTANACAALLHEQPEIGLIDGTGPYAAVFVDDEDVHCVDGSRPVFWIDHARDPVTGEDIDSDRWLLAFRGGPDCGPSDVDRNRSLDDDLDLSAGEDCWEQYAEIPGQWSGDMSSLRARRYNPLSNGAGDAGGIHSTLDDTNDFQTYHRLRIHKCSFDRFDGDRIVSLDDFSGARPSNGSADFDLYFQGRAVLSSVMQQLSDGVQYDAPNDGPTTTMPSLSEASRIVLMSHSNGARGLAYSLDSISAELATVAPDASVFGVLDARMDPSVAHEACTQNSVGAPRSLYEFGHPDCQPTGLLPMAAQPSMYDQDIGFHDSGAIDGDNGNTAFKNLYWHVALDESCLAAHPDDPTQCHDYSHVAFNHLSTPVFFRQALRDSVHTATARPVFASNPMYEWDTGPEGIVPFRDRVFAQAVDVATNAASMHDDPGALYSYPLGIFVEGSDSHVGGFSDVPFVCHDLCGPAGNCGGFRDLLWTWLEGTEVVAIAGYNGWTWNTTACD